MVYQWKSHNTHTPIIQWYTMPKPHVMKPDSQACHAIAYKYIPAGMKNIPLPHQYCLNNETAIPILLTPTT